MSPLTSLCLHFLCSDSRDHASLQGLMHFSRYTHGALTMSVSKSRHGAVTWTEACTRLALSVMGGRGTLGGTPPSLLNFWLWIDSGRWGATVFNHVSAAEPTRFHWITHTDSLGSTQRVTRQNRRECQKEWGVIDREGKRVGVRTTNLHYICV